MKSLNWTRGMGAAACGFLVLMSIIGWFVTALIIDIRRDGLKVGWNGPAPEGRSFEEYATTGDIILLFAVIPLMIVLASTLPPWILGLPWHYSLIPAFVAYLPLALLVLGLASADSGNTANDSSALLPVLLLGVSAVINVLATLLLLDPLPSRATVVLCGVIVALVGAAVAPNPWVQDVAWILSLACWPLIPGVTGTFASESTT